MIWILVGVVAALLAGAFAAGFRVGHRRGTGAVLAASRRLQADPAIGVVVWRKMVASAVRGGTLNPTELVTEQIHQWHRLDEEDQRLIVEAARAALGIAGST